MECAAGLGRLPANQRRLEIARIARLSEAAHRLSQGGAPGRAALLSSTWLADGAGDPADHTSSANTAKLASQCSPI